MNMNLIIGQKLKMVVGTAVCDVTVFSLCREKDDIVGSLEQIDYSQRSIKFRIRNGMAIGSKEVSYSKNVEFSLHETLDAAIIKARENFLFTNNKMRENVEKYMKELVEFRNRNYELLYLDNTEDWLNTFKREYQW